MIFFDDIIDDIAPTCVSDDAYVKVNSPIN